MLLACSLEVLHGPLVLLPLSRACRTFPDSCAYQFWILSCANRGDILPTSVFESCGPPWQTDSSRVLRDTKGNTVSCAEKSRSLRLRLLQLQGVGLQVDLAAKQARESDNSGPKHNHCAGLGNGRRGIKRGNQGSHSGKAAYVSQAVCAGRGCAGVVSFVIAVAESLGTLS